LCHPNIIHGPVKINNNNLYQLKIIPSLKRLKMILIKIKLEYKTINNNTNKNLLNRNTKLGITMIILILIKMIIIKK